MILYKLFTNNISRSRGKPRVTPRKKITPFRKYPLRERRSVILSWIVGGTVAYKVKTSSAKIKPSEIPRASYLPNVLLDQNVDLNEVKEYFQKKAWDKLARLIVQKQVWMFNLGQ